MDDSGLGHPVLLMPPLPGRLTTMRNRKLVPWNPHGGFTVSDLGKRLRGGLPYKRWLEEFGLELVTLGTDDHGTWYELRKL